MQEKKTNIRWGPAKVLPALDCFAAPPWPASQRSSFEGCLCACQLEQITVLGQDFFTVRTDFFQFFNEGVQNTDRVVC